MLEQSVEVLRVRVRCPDCQWAALAMDAVWRPNEVLRCPECMVPVVREADLLNEKALQHLIVRD